MATELHPPIDPPSTPASFVDVDALERLPGQGGMVPPARALPLVLPTDRLNARGMAVPAVREQYRRIHNVRNAANVVSVWIQSFGLIAFMCWLTPRLSLAFAIPLWVATFVLMGRAFALYSILGHEAAHRLLFA